MKAKLVNIVTSSVKAKPGNATSKRRIFLVEDHPVYLEGLVRLINSESDLAVCGTAGDGETALKDILKLEPDLALVDLGLPKKSGLDLIKDLRARKLPIKLLVVSMFDEALYAQRVLRAGGDGYIMKQADPSEIIDSVRDVLNGRIYLSEEVLARDLPAEVLYRGSSVARAADSADNASLLAKLSDAELEILELLGEGKSDQEIAASLQIKASEVKANCAKIQSKLSLGSMNALIRYAVCWVENDTK